MRILLTGGSGDLGRTLTPVLTEAGHEVSIIDPAEPDFPCHLYHPGSLLDLYTLISAASDVDIVIHIAAWHGIHESNAWKTQQEFWELNVLGTKSVVDVWSGGVFPRLIHISSSSVFKNTGYYGFTKRLAEQIIDQAAQAHRLKSITLRPRGFIPDSNRSVYASFADWAQYFWQGAVHIQDVVQAVLKSVDKLPEVAAGSNPKLMLDRLPDFDADELKHWDEKGPGSSFSHKYPQYQEIALKAGLAIHLKPKTYDISETQTFLNYNPKYSLKGMLEELTGR